MCTTQKLNLARVQKWFEVNNATIVNDLASPDTVLCITCNGWSLLEERSYGRRCLGGLRSDIIGHEDFIAKLLECIDSYGVSQGFLNSNYMYGVATQPIVSKR